MECEQGWKRDSKTPKEHEKEQSTDHWYLADISPATCQNREARARTTTTIRPRFLEPEARRATHAGSRPTRCRSPREESLSRGRRRRREGTEEEDGGELEVAVPRPRRTRRERDQLYYQCYSTYRSTRRWLPTASAPMPTAWASCGTGQRWEARPCWTWAQAPASSASSVAQQGPGAVYAVEASDDIWQQAREACLNGLEDRVRPAGTGRRWSCRAGGCHRERVDGLRTSARVHAELCAPRADQVWLKEGGLPPCRLPPSSWRPSATRMLELRLSFWSRDEATLRRGHELPGELRHAPPHGPPRKSWCKASPARMCWPAAVLCSAGAGPRRPGAGAGGRGGVASASSYGSAPLHGFAIWFQVTFSRRGLGRNPWSLHLAFSPRHALKQALLTWTSR